MGTFRFVLAISVLLAHIATGIGASAVNRESLHILVWSGNAVFAFFIVSGFYMSLIINEKYAKLGDGTLRFYLNRALRLYPVHWTMLAMYVLVFVASGTPSFITGHATDPLPRWLYAVTSNTLFFGVELLPLLDVSNWQFVLGPVWSLSLEFYFYLLAPFVVGRRLRTLVAWCAVALAFRLALYHAGAPLLPWRYFFFPADLVLFLMGGLGYHLYVWIRDKPAATWLGWAAAGVLAAAIAWPPLWTAPDLDQGLCWLFYGCVCICTPLLFNLTKHSRLDNLVGQLTYPIYLSHVLVIDVVKRVDMPWADRGVVALVATLGVSVCLHVLIDRPLEPLRRRVESGAPLRALHTWWPHPAAIPVIARLAQRSQRP